MARIRSMHPKILESEDVAAWSAWAQVAWPKIWLVMDDKGRVKDSPQWLASTLFAFNDDQGAAQMRSYIDEWEQSGAVHRYEVDGKRYIHAVNWGEFQRPQKPTPTKLPACPVHDTPTGEGSDSPTVAVREGYTQGGEGRRRGGGEGGEGDARRPPLYIGRCEEHGDTARPPRCGACADARKTGRPLAAVPEAYCLVHDLRFSTVCPGCAADEKAAKS